MEVSCDKRPHRKTLSKHWGDNYRSLVELLGAAHGGIRGLVVDYTGKRMTGATVKLEGSDKETVTNERGEFWRLVLPGVHKLTASMEHISSQTVSVRVTEMLGHGVTEVQLELTNFCSISSIATFG